MRVLFFLPFCSAWEKQEQRGQGCVHPPLVAHVVPGTDRSQLPGTCLGSRGLSVLGDTAGPHSKGVEPALKCLFSGLGEPHLIILPRCHLYFVLDSRPLL